MTHKLKNLEKFKDWVRAGLRVHPDHALELAERVQTAEAKIAAVRDVAVEWERDEDSKGLHSDLIAALDGTA